MAEKSKPVSELLQEYLACAQECAGVDYGVRKSVRRHNKASDRMRSIVDEIVNMGPQAVREFAAVLDVPPASSWAAHHLVEKASLEQSLLHRCFAIVEQQQRLDEAESRGADAMGERMWLREWKAKKGVE